MSDKEESFDSEPEVHHSRARKDFEKQNLLKEFRKSIRKDASMEEKMQTLISQA
jgi:hypothetical protein